MSQSHLDQILAIASARGGECLTPIYVNATTKMRFRCSEGHEWEATPDSIKHDHWCGKCCSKELGERRRGSIEKYAAIAIDKGGQCLSSSYISSAIKLRWICAVGHKWEATPNNIQGGQWCPYCAKRAPLSLEEMRSIAKQRGGDCLSDTYQNVGAHLRWRCREGHEWNTSSNSIRNGTWCPVCAKDIRAEALRGSIEVCHEVAREHGGKLLSGKYESTHTSMLWECSEGHRWKARFSAVNRGSWCPFCAGMRLWAPGESEAHARLAECRTIAQQRGGECLSNSYKSNSSKLRWRCAAGHEWLAASANVKSGTWCPNCTGWLREEMCRALLEGITGERWTKSRPKWLRTSHGGKLELDGYCEPLKIAFEYNGKQHYEFIPHFHKIESAYTKRTIDDQVKRELCKAHGVRLIEIPYNFNNEEMFGLIVEELSNAIGYRVTIPAGLTLSSLGFERNIIKGLNEIAESRGGVCLTQTYLGSQELHRWRCAKGHEWNAAPNNIKFGTWCPICRAADRGSRLKYSLEEIKAIAIERGGECLSTTYRSLKYKLRWRCNEGHEWEALANNVVRGNWCKKCAGIKGGHTRRGSIEEYQSIAQSRGGQCLSTEYRNKEGKLLWRCSLGHEWESRAGCVKRGNWCPSCVRMRKRSKLDIDIK